MGDLKRELKLGNEVGVIIIDIGDYGSVEAAVAQTKVVINTVGPYWKYGDHVVRCVHLFYDFPDGSLHPDRACASHGIHYVDLAGEPHFVKTTIQKFVIPPCFPIPLLNSPPAKRYDHLAHKNNAILIPCCGFDSVPADLVVYLANKTAKSVLGPSAYIEDSVSLYKLKGGPSGGTLATVISSIEEIPKATAEALKDYSYRERESSHLLH